MVGRETRRRGLRCRFVAWCTLVLVSGTVAGTAQEVPLLAVSQGQMPSDVGSDDRSKLSLVERADLGGRALQVERLSGDSFGDSMARVADWRRFGTLEFSAVNGAARPVELGLNILHAGTTDYPTRVDHRVRLRPGRNDVRIDLRSLRNVDGSMPDWEEVRRWYLACEEEQPDARLWFGDFVLKLAGGSTGGAPVGGSPTMLNRAYRVTGKVGKWEVDLRIEPLEAESLTKAESERRSSNEAISRPKVEIRFDSNKVTRIRQSRMPEISSPVMFHTTEADKIVSALEIFPPDHPINQTVDHWPVHPRSREIVESIGASKPLRYNPDMAYIFVPPNQPKIDVALTLYADESDPGPYPVPDQVPLEGWPDGFRQFHRELKMTLPDLQRDTHGLGGDRHAIIVDPVNRLLYEFYQMKRTDRGWQASSAAIFDLKTNRSRPVGWTSADAAGLPIFPTVVRYDELERGIVEHAMRVTVTRTRRAFVAPATHYASRRTDPNLPRMGERLRLKADFDVSPFSPPVQAILKGLKKYGMYVADNGLDWAISVAPDPRIPAMHEELRRVPGSAFEVVVAPWDDAE